MSSPGWGRVPGPSSFSAKKRQLFDAFTDNGAHFADQFSVLSHVTPAVQHLPRMLLELKARNAVPYRFIEMAIVVSLRNDCVRTLLDYADHPKLDALDKLVIESMRSS